MTKRNVRTCSQEAEDTLQRCFEAINWDVLCEAHGDDIDAMTECVTVEPGFLIGEAPHCSGGDGVVQLI